MEQNFDPNSMDMVLDYRCNLARGGCLVCLSVCLWLAKLINLQCKMSCQNFWFFKLSEDNGVIWV